MPDFWYCLHFVCAVFFWCYTITLRQGRWCSQWIGLSVTCLQNECEDSQIKRDQREQVQSGVARWWPAAIPATSAAVVRP